MLITGGARPSQVHAVGLYEHGWSSAPASGTLTQNAVYLLRFAVVEPVTFTSIKYRVGAASNGNVDAGIYSSADMSTWTRVARVGSTAQGTAATVQTLTLPSYTCVPGVQYGLAFGIDSATGSALRGARIDAALAPTPSDLLIFTSAWSSGLPASLSGGAATTTFIVLAMS